MLNQDTTTTKVYGLEDIEVMSDAEMITMYKDQHLHLVMFTGTSTQYDKAGNQKTAKQPSSFQWQQKSVSALEAINAQANGQWVGFMPPSGDLCVDIDHDESIKVFESKLDEYIAAGYIISKTGNGYHLYAKAPADGKYAKGSDSVNRDGLHCTTRDGSRTCCLEQPSPGKKWITDLNWDNLPELMPEWVPTMSVQKWEKQQLKIAEDANKSADQKVKEEKKAAAKKQKSSTLGTMIEKEIECVIRAEQGTRNGAINKCAYTLGGAIAGAKLYDVPVDEAAVLQRLLDAAEGVMPDDVNAAHNAVMAGWNSGFAQPMAMSDSSLRDFVKDATARAAVLAKSDVVPAPGSTFDVAHCAEVAVNVILGTWDMFVYRGQIWGCKQGYKDYRVLSNFADETMVSSLSNLIKCTVTEFYDFDNMRSVPWVQGMTAPIVSELQKRLEAKPEVTLITTPCVINGVWVDRDTPTVRILDIDVVEATCTPQESAQWINEEVLGDYEFETPQDKVKAFIANFAHAVKNDKRGEQLPMIAYTGYQPGLGKTTLATAVGSVGLNEERIYCEALKVNEEEFRKTITTQLLSGVEHYIVDNVKSMFSSALAESLVTGTKWNERILGGHRKCNIDRNCLFLLTVNNAVMSEDMHRRYIGITMIKSYNYLTRPYRHSNINAFLRDNMPIFRGHVNNIVKAWIAAGQMKDKSQKGTSFTCFVENLGGIAQFLGMDCGELINEEKARAESGSDYEDQHILLALWMWTTFGNKEMTKEEILKELVRQKESWTCNRENQLLANINMDALIKDYETSSKFEQNDKIGLKFAYVLKKLQKKVLVDGKIIHVEKCRNKYGYKYHCVCDTHSQSGSSAGTFIANPII